MKLSSLLAGKKVGVVLSSGYFGFFGHAGFVAALEEAGIVPSAWAGSSAGGLVAAFGAAGVSAKTIEGHLSARTKDDFWDRDLRGALLASVRRHHGATGLLKGDRFRALLERLLPVHRFELLRTPLAIVATDLSAQRPRLITSGPLAPALHATCAYPGMFRAVRLDGALLWDGGIIDKAPALALADHAPALDALLVHYLPSNNAGPKEPTGGLAYVQGLSAGFDALRRDHFRLQLEVLAGRGLPTYVVTSSLPRLGPDKLARGAAVVKQAHASVAKALASAPRSFQAD